MIKKLKINLNIIHGKNSFQRLPYILKDYNFKKSIIICDDKIKNINYIKENIKFIKNRFYIAFNEEPSYQQLDKEIKRIKKIKNIDCLIAIGGGSTIDFAKGIAILLKNKGKAIKFMGFPKNLKENVPVIAIPTTSSTGSEIIFNAVFIDKFSKIKLGINYEKNYPLLSILDTKLISNAPRKIINQSAIASLMRAIETYTSPDADEITRFFSKQAFLMICAAINNKRNINYRELQWGCVFSMIALSNSSSGPSGVINYYLSTNYNISQPLSYSFTALEFIRFNINKKYYGYCGLLKNNNQINKKNAEFFIKDIVRIQKLAQKEIKVAKKKLIEKDKELENIFKVFQKKNFLSLLKNPVKIKKKELKNIIYKIVN